MSRVHVEAKDFPVVFIEFPRDPNKADIDEYYRQMVQIADRGRFAIVVDARPVSPKLASPDVRAYFYAIVHRFDRGPGREAMVAEATVLSGKILKLLHQAYSWMTDHRPHAKATFDTIPEARRWCEEQLRLAGVLKQH